MGQVSYTTAEINKGLRKALNKYTISLQCEADAQTICTLADTWYDIDGLFTDGSSNGFTYVSQGGIMEKTGDCECYLFFTGDSDLSIGNSAATITYGLFIDVDGQGFVESTRFTSETTFTTNESRKSLGTNAITPFVVPQGAKGKVMVKSTTPAVVVTHHTLKITSFEM